MSMLRTLVLSVGELEVASDEVVKWVFDGIRNVGLAAGVIWVGAQLYYHPNGLAEKYLSGVVVLTGLLLMSLNVIWKARKLLRSGLSRPAALFLFLVILAVLSAVGSVAFRTRPI